MNKGNRLDDQTSHDKNKKRKSKEAISIRDQQRQTLQKIEEVSKAERAEYKRQKRNIERQRRDELNRSWNALYETVKNITPKHGFDQTAGSISSDGQTQEASHGKNNIIASRKEVVERSISLIQKLHGENKKKDIIIMTLRGRLFKR